MNSFAMYAYHRRWHSMGSVDSLAALMLLVMWTLLVLAVLAFEVWMFFDCILDSKMPNKNKVWWVIGMLLLHPIVAIFYYFMVYRVRGQKRKK